MEIKKYASGALVDEIKARNSLAGSKAEIQASLSRVVDAIKSLTDRGEPVRIAGFGTFKKVHRAGRSGRNPQTGETIQIAGRDALKFTPSKKG